MRRIWLVAVCCSRASVRTRFRSTYDGSGEGVSLVGLRRVPHSPQNFWPSGFWCWHRGHCMLRPPSESKPGNGRTGGESLVWGREGVKEWSETVLLLHKNVVG